MWVVKFCYSIISDDVELLFLTFQFYQNNSEKQIRIYFRLLKCWIIYSRKFIFIENSSAFLCLLLWPSPRLLRLSRRFLHSIPRTFIRVCSPFVVFSSKWIQHVHFRSLPSFFVCCLAAISKISLKANKNFSLKWWFRDEKFFKEEIEFSRLLRVLVMCTRALVYVLERVGWAV